MPGWSMCILFISLIVKGCLSVWKGTKPESFRFSKTFSVTAANIVRYCFYFYRIVIYSCTFWRSSFVFLSFRKHLLLRKQAALAMILLCPSISCCCWIHSSIVSKTENIHLIIPALSRCINIDTCIIVTSILFEIA